MSDIALKVEVLSRLYSIGRRELTLMVMITERNKQKRQSLCSPASDFVTITDFLTT